MRVVVAGGSGGIGRAFIDVVLKQCPEAVVCATWHRTPPPFEHPRVQWTQVDLSDDDAVADFAARVEQANRVFNAAGLLHTETHGPEKKIASVDPAFFIENIAANTLPTLLLAKHFGPRLMRQGTSVFAALSARVGSIEDNALGGWTSYRCSKAALNMALRNISIEWARSYKNVAVVALHPGTADTKLSSPFQASVKPGQLMSADRSAQLLLRVIENLSPEQSGKFFAYDGSEIPW